MAGYTKSFQGYVDAGARREATVENCSIWCTYSRFVAIHGTHEADIINNVCFWALMSGIFTEDGTESNNTIEHNLVCAVQYCTPNRWFNPLDGRQLYGHVASDCLLTGAIWLKSNNNACLRNVTCCSPSPVIGIWSVPQNIKKLRGPSTFCKGSGALGLPSIGVRRSNEVHWVPDAFVQAGVCHPDGHVWFGESNDSIPYFRLIENVCYNMAGYWSEFPDGHFTILESAGHQIVEHLIQKHPEWQAIHSPLDLSRFLFLPSNTQNASIDGNIGRALYFKSSAKERVSKAERDRWFPGARRKQLYCETEDRLSANRTQDTWDLLPKIFTGMLTFNLGPAYNLLNFGAGWAKQSGVILSNCALLADGESAISYIGDAQYPTKTGSAFICMVGDDKRKYKNVFHVYDNVITNGAICVPPNPLVLCGQYTRFDRKTMGVVHGEYVDNDQTDGSCIYFTEHINTDIFNRLYSPQYPNGTYNRKTFAFKRLSEQPVGGDKYGCLCRDGALLRADGNVIPDRFFGLFDTAAGVVQGDTWCQHLSRVAFDFHS